MILKITIWTLEIKWTTTSSLVSLDSILNKCQITVYLGSVTSRTHLEWGWALKFRALDLVRCRIQWMEGSFKKMERIRNLKWWTRWSTSLTCRTNRRICLHLEWTGWPLWTVKCLRTHLTHKQEGLKTICKWALMASVWWVIWVSHHQWSNLLVRIKRRLELTIRRKLNAGFDYML